MSAPIPINSSNVQWLVWQQSNKVIPSCATTLSSPASTIGILGDFIVATNRCSCSPSSSQNTSASCAYSTIQASNNTILYYNCGKDTTCTKGCSFVSAVSTLSVSPCAIGFTGQYGSSDYTSTSTWDSSFMTSHFAYATFTVNDATCRFPGDSNRIPVYPTCTKVLAGVYGYTIANPSSGMLEQYGCSDAGCNTCQLASRGPISAACTANIGDSDTFYTEYRAGIFLSDPTLQLPTTFPNQTRPIATTTATPYPDSPSPSTDAGSSAGLIGGIVAGVVALVVAVGVFVWLRRSKSEGKPSYPQAPVSHPIASSSALVNDRPTSVYIPYSQATQVPSANIQPAYSQPAYSQPPASYPYGSAAVPMPSHAPTVSQSYSGSLQPPQSHIAGVPQYSSYRNPSPVLASAPAPPTLSYSESVGAVDRVEGYRPGAATVSAVVQYTVISAFDTKDPAQTNLNLGDVILVHSPFVNGFAQGFNRSTGLSVLVPQHCLRVIDEAHTHPLPGTGDGLPSYMA
ncbi:uncharacterized protein BJ171DRAFT_602626 [Polychytrium aggregatum]|uniref:uncharacterized protein n=1 Tax=Polychytrium aggregatum TaxID=110093 RepID=UPI0022FDD55A|nr:uncharacterized protein BJ171DRAFT_602626 [Polychytrium aggregatum]KAI9197107.1 hypothetical protein BJ171DRAFT_602626 [Polychytrium aggregatum]